MARAAGVTIVTLVPHCSHKMQYLDKTVFSSFKTAYDATCETWLLNHPSMLITMYKITELVNITFNKALHHRISNLDLLGQRIYPFNENIVICHRRSATSNSKRYTSDYHCDWELNYRGSTCLTRHITFKQNRSEFGFQHCYSWRTLQISKSSSKNITTETDLKAKNHQSLLVLLRKKI